MIRILVNVSVSFFWYQNTNGNLRLHCLVPWQLKETVSPALLVNVKSSWISCAAMATSAVEKQTHRWRSVWQCLLKVEFVGSWLAGNTHLNTDSTEQQLGGKAFCAVVFPLVNLGRSGALMQLRPNKDELWDQTRATWFLTGPQTSHQPLQQTHKAAVWQ